ncbi:MAG: hypothetical protein LBP37_05675 [Spirochaetaceae bacterium]|jgi:hypothetical protein|nr:hypothetical protein [Spirochaetaceae bacterium]
MVKKYICAFADRRLSPALKRFGKQAKQMGIYDGIFLYNENNLDKSFREFFKDKLKLRRGFGYWVWKPQIILQTLEKLNDGDLLQYADAGCHLNPKGLKRLNDYFEIVNESETGLLAFEMPDYTEKQWTKGDLFDYFGVRNNPDIYPAQIAATVLFLRKSKKSVEVIQKWMQVFYDNFALADDTPSLSPNFPEFIENRHDQSIWSILVKLNGVTRLSHSEQCEVDEKYPIWALRDKREKFRISHIPVLAKRILKKAAKRILTEALYNRLKELNRKLKAR